MEEIATLPPTLSPIVHPAGQGTPVRQADSDRQMVELWLHGRSKHTQRAYRSDVDRFLSFVAKPLAQVTLGDVQAFSDSLHGSAASQARTIAAVKSLLSSGHGIGYLPFDVGAPVRCPAQKETLAERILSEPQVQRILALEPNCRNRVLLQLLYAAGVRVSEACGLKWRDCMDRADGQGQVTVFGKGSKTRAILLPASVWGDLVGLRRDAGLDGPVFRSQKGGALDASRVRRIVYAAARRAGIAVQVSPHWLRHAHATHALDRGAPIHLVQATLGHSSVATTGRYLHARPTDSSSRFLAI